VGKIWWWATYSKPRKTYVGGELLVGIQHCMVICCTAVGGHMQDLHALGLEGS